MKSSRRLLMILSVQVDELVGSYLSVTYFEQNVAVLLSFPFILAGSWPRKAADDQDAEDSYH
jgi:hypothetical protein